MSPSVEPARPLVVVVGPLETNCYLFPADEGLLIVDPGDEPDRIAQACASLGEPRAILLTHGHPDHTAAAPALAERFGIPVLAPEADRQWLEGNFDLWGFPVEPLRCDWQDVSQALPEGLRLLATPGHSPGSVCFLAEGAGFVGDLIFRGSVGRADLPGSDPAQLMASLRLLVQEVPPDLPLFPGHGPATTIAAELAINPWLQEALSHSG
ncbi:MAG: MBL fold metallo-hydrolase [Armatimonadetes bacterium]|nr:MBL fold metallo-hydrolase [Armatimonadota bacterium]